MPAMDVSLDEGDCSIQFVDQQPSYDDMREAITKEMLLTNSATKSWSDADLLRNFYDCEYLIAICVMISF